MRILRRWQHQYLGLNRLPSNLSTLEMDAFFTFSQAEIGVLQSRYKSTLRIGAALQVGFLKMSGRPLEIVRVVQRKLLAHVALQLGVDAPSIASLRAIYRRRRATLYEHQTLAIQINHFVRPTDSQFEKLLTHMKRECLHGRSVDELVELGKVWLYQHGFVIPADRPIRDYARQAMMASEEGLFSYVLSRIPEMILRQWEKQLFQLSDGGRKTYLEWLSDPPRKRNRTALHERTERVDFLRSLKVDQYLLDEVPLAKIRLYGEAMWHMRPSKFRELSDPVKTLRMVCFLQWMLIETTDTALLMAGHLITRLWGDAYRKAELLQAKRALSSKSSIQSIFEWVDDPKITDEQFRHLVREMKAARSGEEFPTRAAAARWLLSDPNNEVRPLLKELEKLNLNWEPDCDAATLFNTVKRYRLLGYQELPEKASIEIGKGWRDIVDGADRERALRALEASTLMEFKKGLRNGQAWIEHSAAFRHRDSLLIQRDRWNTEKNRHYKRLNKPTSAKEFLDPIFEVLKQKLQQVDQAVTNGEISIEDELVHIPRLKAELPPSHTTSLRDQLFKTIGPVQLPDLIMDVDSRTGFSQAILGHVPRSELELLKVYAGMMAHATAFTATQVAQQIPQLSAEHVLSGMTFFERSEQVRAANAAVASYQRQLPLTRIWGDDTLASSDNMSLDVSRKLWTARLDPKRGTPSVGTYTHWVNSGGLIYDQPLVLGNRQAGAAIEGVIRQEEITIDQLAVDTHGYTAFAMAIAKLLGFDLCPRLKQLSERKLYLPREWGDIVPESLEEIVDFNVSLSAIDSQWDALMHIASSISTGHTNAMIALSRFGSAAHADPVYKGGVALGRLLRTVFLCDYFISEPFRRIINRILVQGESIHRLQRAIHRGSFTLVRGQREAELIALSGSLTLMTNLCLAWTSTRIQMVLDQKPLWLKDHDNLWLKSVNPGHFENINFQGTFSFNLGGYAERLFKDDRIALNE